MRILYIHQHFSTTKGASGTRSYEMAKSLVSKGHQVTVICGSSDRSRVDNLKKMPSGLYVGNCDGIKVIQIKIDYSNYNAFYSRVLKFVKFSALCVLILLREPYELLFATSTPLTVAFPGIISKIIYRKRPFVFEVRDLWPELPKALGVIKNPLALRLLELLEICSYRFADSCIGLSPGIVEGIKKRAPSNRKIEMIPNGCDTDLFKPVLKKFTSTKWESEPFTAVFSGAHGLANGLDSILDAAAELIERRRLDIRFILIGDGIEKPRLKRRKNQENLENCLFFDPVPKDKLPSVLQKCDVGLMVLKDCPSFYYGTSPNKFFDYIAMGLPVINNYPGWVNDLIVEHDCGNVVNPGDASSFANALETLADNPRDCKRMGSNARQLALNTFDRNLQSNLFINFLQDTFNDCRMHKNKKDL